MANVDNGAQGAGAQAGAKSASFQVLTQYVKDLSFENPGAPRSLAESVGEGGVTFEISIATRGVSDDVYEVALTIEARGEAEKAVVFNLELVYAGLFRIENVQREALPQLLMIEAPRLLFPFARQILAEATRNGGFRPLLIDPIDFAALYRQQMAKRQAEGGMKLA